MRGKCAYRIKNYDAVSQLAERVIGNPTAGDQHNLFRARDRDRAANQLRDAARARGQELWRRGGTTLGVPGR